MISLIGSLAWGGKKKWWRFSFRHNIIPPLATTKGFFKSLQTCITPTRALLLYQQHSAPLLSLHPLLFRSPPSYTQHSRCLVVSHRFRHSKFHKGEAYAAVLPVTHIFSSLLLQRGLQICFMNYNLNSSRGSVDTRSVYSSQGWAAELKGWKYLIKLRVR